MLIPEYEYGRRVARRVPLVYWLEAFLLRVQLYLLPVSRMSGQLKASGSIRDHRLFAVPDNADTGASHTAALSILYDAADENFGLPAQGYRHVRVEIAS
jgi:hypothetical protein